MLIECPICHARAQLPSSKEGAKVRCGECGRVYVALPPGARANRSRTNTGALIGAGVGLAALIVIVLVYRKTRGEEETTTRAAAKVEEPETAAYTDDLGWKGPTVQTAVRIHEAVFMHDATALRAMLHGPRIWAREQVAPPAEADEAAGSEADGAEGAEPAAEAVLADAVEPAVPPPTPAEFHLLPKDEQDADYQRWIDDLLEGPGRDLVADWLPYDGEVIELTDDDAHVRLAVRPRDPKSVEKRWVDWKLARDGTKWKAWSWERYISPEELAAQRRRRARGYEKVTLSDGSVVFEREPEPLEHLEDTPPDVRKRIDEAYATMIDLDLTKEAIRAQDELVEIGKPSIPILLTGLYEIPLDTEDNAKKVNLIVQALRRISGEYMGFKPMLLVGSGVGTSEERRQSAIKQWFAWWYRRQDKFTEKETTDGLEGLIELTDQEKRWLERHQDE